MMMIMMKMMMYELRYIINNCAQVNTVIMYLQRIIARDTNVNSHCDKLSFRNSSLSTNNNNIIIIIVLARSS